MQIPTVALLPKLSLLLSPLVSNASQSSAPGSSIQQWVNQFASGSTQVLQVVNAAFKDVLGLSWITLISLGVLLYLTHLHRKLGKDFIVGGVVMAVLVQFVFPWIATI